MFLYLCLLRLSLEHTLIYYTIAIGRHWLYSWDSLGFQISFARSTCNTVTFKWPFAHNIHSLILTFADSFIQPHTIILTSWLPQRKKKKTAICIAYISLSSNSKPQFGTKNSAGWMNEAWSFAHASCALSEKDCVKATVEWFSGCTICKNTCVLLIRDSFFILFFSVAEKRSCRWDLLKKKNPHVVYIVVCSI